MLTNAEHRRLEELSRAMNERPLTPEESAELGNLMALDMGASRERKRRWAGASAINAAARPRAIATATGIGSLSAPSER